jgi:serine/threonine protein kinase
VPQDRAERPGNPSQPVIPATGTLASISESNASPQGGIPQAPAGTYFLGRYRVVDEIGIGGMASVHLGRMDGPGGFQKWVAIKRIHPHLIEDETFIQMFLDEARVAARISHPNVATVFELGKHEDTYWIAMEYLHGEPLREVMRRTEELGAPMPPEIACRVIADAAEGLNAAHELLGKNGEKLNLIHRDVTPHNLFVTYDGTTKVVDFGIAKFSSRMSSTRAGTLKGKLAYMSPEQVQGEPIDRRTDIFALGVVLWELTTGQRLFRMESDLDTLAKVQECNIPRPSTIVRGYPIDLEKIVMKALAKNRGERFRTAREFSRALQSLLMRRGLFIASDEVAGYMQSIFQDRIAKREAHLRWAGEVTQTINVEGMLGPAPATLADPSIRSYNSEIQASQAQVRNVPRPAAGAPPVSNYLASSGASPASAPTQVPPSQQQPISPMPPRAAQRSPSSASHLAETQSAPAARAPRPAQQAPMQEHHPADDDGPTIQATAEQRAAVEYARASVDDLDYDDNDDTIVTTTQVEPSSSQPPGAAPLPAAGRPAQPPRPPQYGGAPYYQQGGGGPRTLPINTQAPVIPPNVPHPYGQPSQQQAVNPVGATIPPNLNISDPSLPSTRIGAREEFGFQYPPGPGGPAAAPTYPPGMAQGMGPRPPAITAPRLFAPPQAHMTQTSMALHRRLPMWAVAVGSGLAALLVAGLVFLLVTHATAPSPPKPVATGKNPASTPSAATGSTAVAGPTPFAPASAPTPISPPRTGGLFVTARDAFLTSITAPPAPAPTSMLPAQPPPTATAPLDTTPTPPPAPTANAFRTDDSTSQRAQPRPPPSPPPSPPPDQATAAAPAPQPVPRRVSSSDQSGPVAQGMISVICIPACDTVIDNGKPIGSSPIFKRSVNVGSHRLKLVSGSFSKTVSVSVIVDQLAVVRESMQP